MFEIANVAVHNGFSVDDPAVATRAPADFMRLDAGIFDDGRLVATIRRRPNRFALRTLDRQAFDLLASAFRTRFAKRLASGTAPLVQRNVGTLVLLEFPGPTLDAGILGRIAHVRSDRHDFSRLIASRAGRLVRLAVFRVFPIANALFSGATILRHGSLVHAVRIAGRGTFRVLSSLVFPGVAGAAAIAGRRIADESIRTEDFDLCVTRQFLRLGGMAVVVLAALALGFVTPARRRSHFGDFAFFALGLIDV